MTPQEALTVLQTIVQGGGMKAYWPDFVKAHQALATLKTLIEGTPNGANAAVQGDGLATPTPGDTRDAASAHGC